MYVFGSWVVGSHRQKQQLQKDQIGKMVDDFINVKLLSLFDLCDFECQVCAIFFS